MRILEVTNYTAGICGVGTRVKQEAEMLSQRGHEVCIFSSFFVKGTNERAPREEMLGRVKVVRFPAHRLGGESFMFWNFERKALVWKPDVIIVHAYRHLHTTRALRIARKIGARVFLVTHAPFVEENTQRSLLGKMAVQVYDLYVGPRTLKRFDKIIAITHWELPYLQKLGVPAEKIAYIPNGIPDTFFTQKKGKEDLKKILFLGRIAPVKQLETLILALSSIQSGIEVELVGPAEEAYRASLQQLIKQLQLEKRVSFSGPVSELKKKIKKIDSAKIFVLPSQSEALPQALMEVLARGKIVIASDTAGARELIRNGENGLLFPRGDTKKLTACIRRVLQMNPVSLKKMQKAARTSVKRFSWKKIIDVLEQLF